MSSLLPYFTIIAYDLTPRQDPKHLPAKRVQVQAAALLHRLTRLSMEEGRLGTLVPSASLTANLSNLIVIRPLQHIAYRIRTSKDRAHHIGIPKSLHLGFRRHSLRHPPGTFIRLPVSKQLENRAIFRLPTWMRAPYDCHRCLNHLTLALRRIRPLFDRFVDSRITNFLIFGRLAPRLFLLRPLPLGLLLYVWPTDLLPFHLRQSLAKH